MGQSPSPDDELAFNSDLEIDCESSVSLDASFFDSDSENEEVIMQKLEQARDSLTSNNSRSDTNLVELKTDSSDPEEDSSDSEESSDESEISSPPLKRARHRMDLAPKQHSVIVTRRRLSKQHLEMLRCRKALPNSRSQDTHSDSSSEYETAIEEEDEEEARKEMLGEKLENGEVHRENREEGEKEGQRLENVREMEVVEKSSEKNKEEKDKKETNKQGEKEDDVDLEVGDEKTSEENIRVALEEEGKAKKTDIYDFDESDSEKKDLSENNCHNTRLIKECVGQKKYYTYEHHINKLDCKDVEFQKETNVASSCNEKKVITSQKQKKETENGTDSTSVKRQWKSGNFSSTYRFSLFKVPPGNMLGKLPQDYILCRNNKKGLNYRQKLMDKKSHLFKGAFRHRKKFISCSADHLRRKYIAHSKNKIQTYFHKNSSKLLSHLDSRKNGVIGKELSIRNQESNFVEPMNRTKTSTLFSQKSCSPLTVSSHDSENESSEVEREKRVKNLRNFIPQDQTEASHKGIHQNNMISLIESDCRKVLECADQDRNCSSVHHVNPTTGVSKSGMSPHATIRNSGSNSRGFSTASLTREIVLDQPFKMVEISEQIVNSVEKSSKSATNSKQPNDETSEQESSIFEMKTSDTSAPDLQSNRDFTETEPGLSNLVRTSKEPSCSKKFNGAQVLDFETCDSFTEGTSRSVTKVEMNTKNLTEEASNAEIVDRTVSEKHSNILKESVMDTQSSVAIQHLEPKLNIDLTIPPSFIDNLRGLLKKGATNLSSKTDSQFPDTLNTDADKEASETPESYNLEAVPGSNVVSCRKRRKLKPPLRVASPSDNKAEKLNQIKQISPQQTKISKSDIQVCSREIQSKNEVNTSHTSSPHHKSISVTSRFKKTGLQYHEAVSLDKMAVQTNSKIASEINELSVDDVNAIPSSAEDKEIESLTDLSLTHKAEQNKKDYFKEKLPPHADCGVSLDAPVRTSQAEKVSQSAHVPSVVTVSKVTGPRKFDPCSQMAVDGLKSCFCDRIQVGMLLTVKQIRRKTWPYRIESILLSLLGGEALSSCRSCSVLDNRHSDKYKDAGKMLSDSCVLFTWAAEDGDDSPIRTIPLLKTKHLENVKLRLGAGAYYPCLGQCGIISCGYISFSVATLRRHVKDRCLSALKYCGLSYDLILEEYRTGNRVFSFKRDVQPISSCDTAIFARGRCIWSDNSNLSDMQNSIKTMKAEGPVPCNMTTGGRARLHGLDHRILELVNLLKTDDTDLLVDILISCFYNTLSCASCWEKASLSKYLPDSWLKYKAPHYRNCQRPRRPTCHKTTSTADLNLEQPPLQGHEFDFGCDNILPAEPTKGYSVSYQNDLRKRTMDTKYGQTDQDERAVKLYRDYLKRRRVLFAETEKYQQVKEKRSRKARDPTAGTGESETADRLPRPDSLKPLLKSARRNAELPVMTEEIPDSSDCNTTDGQPSPTTNSHRSKTSAVTKPRNKHQGKASADLTVPSTHQTFVPITKSSSETTSLRLADNCIEEQPLPVQTTQQKQSPCIPFDFYSNSNLVEVKSTETVPASDNTYPSRKLAISKVRYKNNSTIPQSSCETVPRPSSGSIIPVSRKVAIPICPSGGSPFHGVTISGSNKYDVMVVGGKLSVSNPRRFKLPATTYTVADRSKPKVYSVPAHKIVPLHNFVRSNTLSELQSVISKPEFLGANPAKEAPTTTFNPHQPADEPEVGMSSFVLDAAQPRPSSETPTNSLDQKDHLLMPLCEKDPVLISCTEETEVVDVETVESDNLASQVDKPQTVNKDRGSAGSFTSNKTKVASHKALTKTKQAYKDKASGSVTVDENCTFPRRSERLSVPTVTPEKIATESSRRRSKRISNNNSLSEGEASDHVKMRTRKQIRDNDPECFPGLEEQANNLAKEAKSLFEGTENLLTRKLRNRNVIATSPESKSEKQKDEVLLFPPGKKSKPSINCYSYRRNSGASNETLLAKYVRSKRNSIAVSDASKDKMQKNQIKSPQTGKSSRAVSSVESLEEGLTEGQDTLLSRYLLRRRNAAAKSIEEKSQVESSSNSENSRARPNAEETTRKSDRLTIKNGVSEKGPQNEYNETAITMPAVKENSNLKAEKINSAKESQNSGRHTKTKNDTVKGNVNGTACKKIEKDERRDINKQKDKISTKTKTNGVNELDYNLCANRKMDQQMNERLKLLNLIHIDKDHSKQKETKSNNTSSSVYTAGAPANGANCPHEVRNKTAHPPAVDIQTTTLKEESQNSARLDTTPSGCPLTLEKRPASPQLAALAAPWEDTVRVKVSGSTVLVRRSELLGDYPHILNKLSAAIQRRPDDIRGVMNTTRNRKLRPTQDTFSKTLQRDDELVVSLRRPTEASGQHETGVDEDLQKLQNVLLVLVRFPLSTHIFDCCSSTFRAVWVDKWFTPSPNRTTYALTDGSVGTLYANHVTYMKRGENFTSIRFLHRDEKALEKSQMLKELLVKRLDTLVGDVTIATTPRDGAKVHLKYWYRDDVFTCFLLSDFTLQVNFTLSETTVIVNVKEDYYCHLRNKAVLDEGCLSLQVLGAELTDKLNYLAKFALPTILEDVAG
ncbi:hypothetical protein ACHWQZ_G005531 [Mnemiopsis leidyi]